MPSDIKTNHWLFVITPKKWHDYILLMRLDRPIGTWLLLIPCLWGLAIYHQQLSYQDWLRYVGIFALGAFVLRSAGCVWNDILDREFDKKVVRTKNRPLASGRVGVDDALKLLAVLLAIGLVMLFLLGNHPAQVVALLSLGLVVPYPLMKRIFPLPQLWLGFTFNIGILVAGMLTTNDYFNIGLWWLYIIGVLWTLAYDTIYALQDKDEDALLGLKSSALLFGKHIKTAIGVFYLSMAGLLLGLIYYLGDGNRFAYVYWLLAGFAMFDSYDKVHLKQPYRNLRVFRRQWLVGLFIFLALYYR
ncbi:MAG: 4-hydroxybenzoate octaprenyltransferase [Alphaproteobacteria bacterium]